MNSKGVLSDRKTKANISREEFAEGNYSNAEQNNVELLLANLEK